MPRAVSEHSKSSVDFSHYYLAGKILSPHKTDVLTRDDKQTEQRPSHEDRDMQEERQPGDNRGRDWSYSAQARKC